MNFPVQLLPSLRYKMIVDDISSFVLVRYVKLEEETLVNPDTGHIREQYVVSPRKRIADYSTNFLGVFELEHLKIQLAEVGKTEYNEYCEPDSIVHAPNYPTHYDYREKVNFFFLNISDIHLVKVSFRRNDKEMEAECRVEHTPMRWNFWHFSVRWYLGATEQFFLHAIEEKELDKGWAKQLCSLARAIIINNASVEVPNIPTIPEDYYQKIS